uniref:Uncharacterized protein n=1 Tax=Myoviridae sp. ctLnO19 TaxID=2825085 RepID=A0A8S5NZX9_9CAUD|nr:MAG TPA: hypothetical protein [Myoviridae sp. ctLnO19]
MNTKNELITALVENLNKADIPLPGELIVKNYETLGGITAEGYRYKVSILDKETGNSLINHVFFDVGFKSNLSEFLDGLNILKSYIQQYYVNQVHEVFSTQLQNAFDVLTNKKTNELFNVVVQTEPDAFDVEATRIRSKASIYHEVSGDEILTRTFAFDTKIIIRPDLPERVDVDEIGLVSMYLAKEVCNRIGYEFEDILVAKLENIAYKKEEPTEFTQISTLRYNTEEIGSGTHTPKDSAIRKLLKAWIETRIKFLRRVYPFKKYLAKLNQYPIVMVEVTPFINGTNKVNIVIRLEARDNDTDQVRTVIECNIPGLMFNDYTIQNLGLDEIERHVDECVKRFFKEIKKQLKERKGND